MTNKPTGNESVTVEINKPPIDKHDCVKIQYLNAALPVLKEIGHLMQLLGHERYERKNPSHDFFISYTFEGHLAIEIRKNDGGQKVQWMLRGGNGYYENLYLVEGVDVSKIAKHRVSCQIRGSAVPAPRKGKPQPFLSHSHWLQRLFLINTRLHIDAHEAGINPYAIK